MNLQELQKIIIKDFAIECEEEFDLNFRRKAFFDSPWAPVKAEPGVGSLMLRTGALRQSIRYSPTPTGVSVTSDTPYASIHNEGGVISRQVRITEKMRRFFWAKWVQTKDPRWRAAALTKKAAISQTIRVPRRQFVGDHPVMRNNLKKIAEAGCTEYARELRKQFKI